jgi:Uma2 family endonuclease
MFGSMADAARDARVALYEQYQKVPRHQCAEIIHGTLYVRPRPAPPHANATSVLGGELSGPFQRGRGGPGGWWILDEPELQLIDLEAVVPDLAGWRVERMPELPETAYFALAPDWVCEVLSPSTATVDREDKMPVYAREGVPHAWLVDPIARTLEVFTLGAGRRWLPSVTHRDAARVRVAPFDAIEIALELLWAK